MKDMKSSSEVGFDQLKHQMSEGETTRHNSTNRRNCKRQIQLRCSTGRLTKIGSLTKLFDHKR